MRCVKVRHITWSNVYHEVKCSNHNGYLDQTIKDCTLDLHVELLAHAQNFLYYQEIQLEVTTRHEGKIFLIQPRATGEKV